MPTTEREDTTRPLGGTSPPTRGADPPTVALRTYRFLRLGAVAVIAILAFSLLKEYNAAGDCLQGSISAYYYTSVQSVFVGTLVALGMVMIVLWGKSPWEDAWLNLAGMLAPVVAFVPTVKPTTCGLEDVTGNNEVTGADKTELVESGHEAVINNMTAYLVVIAIALGALLVIGILAYAGVIKWASATDNWKALWIPWAVAAALWLFGAYQFWVNDREDWFYDNAHQWSAIPLFVFILAAIVDIGFQKKPIERYRYLHEGPNMRWAWTYWGLAAVMAVGAVAVFIIGKQTSGAFHDHRTFWLEAWMIFWLAVFWILQTVDRWTDGAPLTKAERNQPRDAFERA